MTNQIKQRFFEKVYKNAALIKCACGCGIDIKNKDRYGRDKLFINGHNRRKYNDPKQYKREWNYRNSAYLYKAKLARGRRLKVKIIELLGGKCTHCSLPYNGENACVFQAHHVKPSKKITVINTRTLTSFSWEKIQKEIKKCILLCANCHFINHNEKY